jgi:hypothetical protein
MTSERIFWAYANLVLPPSWAFLLFQFQNVSSRARGMPKVQTQRMNLRLFPFCASRTHLISQVKVRRTSTSIPPTTVVCPTYRGELEEPGRLASWLLRAPLCEYSTRCAPRRSTKPCAGQAWSVGTSDPPEQCSYRGGRLRLKEEGQAERRSGCCSDTNDAVANCRCLYGHNSGNHGTRGNSGDDTRRSCRRSPTNNARVKQRKLADSARWIVVVDDAISHRHVPRCSTHRKPTTIANTEEEESCSRSGRGRHGGWEWWGSQWWWHEQEAGTAARGSATCRLGERMRRGEGRVYCIFLRSNLLLSILFVYTLTS